MMRAQWWSWNERRHERQASQRIAELIVGHLPDLDRRLGERRARALARRAAAYEPSPMTLLGESDAVTTATTAILLQRVSEQLEIEIEVGEQFEAAFLRRYARCRNDDQREACIRAQLDRQKSGRSLGERWRDSRAVGARLDIDAMAERAAEFRQARSVLIELAIVAQGGLTGAALSSGDPEARDRITVAHIHESALHWLANSNRWHARWKAAKNLVLMLDGVPEFELESHHQAVLVARIREASEHPWVRIECLRALSTRKPAEAGALRMALLQKIAADAEDFHRWDFVMRRRVLEDARSWPEVDAALALLRDHLVRGEPSEYVQLGLVDTLGALAQRNPQAIEILLRWTNTPKVLQQVAPEAANTVPTEKVRAAAIRTISLRLRAFVHERPGHGHGHDLDALWLEVRDALSDIVRALSGQFLTRTAIRAMVDISERLREVADGLRLDELVWPWMSALASISSHDDRTPALTEQASAARESLSRALDHQRSACYAELESHSEAMAAGELRKWTLDENSPLLRASNDVIGRALAELSREDWGLYWARRGKTAYLQRGERFETRMWRLLYELRTPAPNKRQAYPHTVGRDYHGWVRAHPGGLHEVTPTVVPGERVHIAHEGGWGRHLPGIDDLVGSPSPSHARPIELYSSHGVTKVFIRGHALQRWLRQFRMQLRYPQLDRARRSCLASDENAQRGAFIQELRTRYGVEVEFSPHKHARSSSDAPPGQELQALFVQSAANDDQGKAQSKAAAALPFSIDLGDWVETNSHYFMSFEGNSQTSLGSFALLMASYFFIDGYRRRRRVERARGKIPLCVGGWGTRGKSGTERLKAGLFHGLGYRVFSKTTGCEAMFIHSLADGTQQEIYAFRPYGKATIWEQRDLLELAAALEVDVFLWECMALSPDYVDILQHSWMRDDVATLTNAYPDHEDIQGPAGMDVAKVISRFIPRNSRVVSSETNFLPLMRDVAARRNSEMVPIDPDEGDFIADDMLALFPYDEHPRNIALVGEMAHQLGVDPDLAIFTMAVNVVPDLGVLKTYPDVRVLGRVMRFINGCSANERAGFMNNWVRTGLNRFETEHLPDRVLVTVVNNRDDRISRSEVFARILVNDVAADRHVLIGTNLRGLLGYLEASLDELLLAMRVVSERDLRGGDPEVARQRLERALRRLRLPHLDESFLRDRLAVYARGCGAAVGDAELMAATRRGLELAEELASSALGLRDIRKRITEDDAWTSAITALAQSSGAAPERLDPAECVQTPAIEDYSSHAARQLSRAILRRRLEARLESIFSEKNAAGIEDFHELLHDSYRELFMDLLEVVEDSSKKGDQIMVDCARSVPPGTDVTILGTQNIKGTGLDFAYRWLAIDAVKTLIERAQTAQGREQAEAFNHLESFADHGIGDTGTLVDALKNWDAPMAGNEAIFQRVVAKANRVHESKLAALESSASGRQSRAGLWKWLEGWLEFIDGAYRFHHSRRLMKDLSEQRVSHGKAALSMRNLYDRAKGGWLLKTVERHRLAASTAKADHH